MKVICTLYWTDDNKYKLISNWNEELATGDINDICREMKEQDKIAKKNDKEKKLENKK